MISQNYKSLSVFLKIFFIGTLFFSNCSLNKKSTTANENPLLKIENLSDLYWNSSGQSDLNQWGRKDNHTKYLILSTFYPDYDSTVLNDTVFYDKSGYPIKWKNITPEYGKRTYYYFRDFYKNQTTGVYVYANHYDTVITVIQYDSNHQVRRSMVYNQTRNVIEHFNDYQFTPLNDSSIHFIYTKCDVSLSLKELVPAYVFDCQLTLHSDSILYVNGNRTVVHDTSYNNDIVDTFLIKNKRVVSAKTSYSTSNNKKDRTTLYYEKNDTELVAGWKPKERLIDSLCTIMNTFYDTVWERQNKATNAFLYKKDSVENGLFDKSITLKSSTNLTDFTPALWYQITSDTGYLECYKSLCAIVAYNTPIANDDNQYFRCLAIFKYVNGQYELIDQYLHALDPFYDQDDDLLFNRFDEVNINLSIYDNSINILYEYMRSNADFTLIFKNNDWVLNEYSYSSNSYDYFSRSTYNYTTRKLTEERIYHGEEPEGNDTTIVTIKSKPTVQLKELSLVGDSLY